MWILDTKIIWIWSKTEFGYYEFELLLNVENIVLNNVQIYFFIRIEYYLMEI